VHYFLIIFWASLTLRPLTQSTFKCIETGKRFLSVDSLSWHLTNLLILIWNHCCSHNSNPIVGVLIREHHHLGFFVGCILIDFGIDLDCLRCFFHIVIVKRVFIDDFDLLHCFVEEKSCNTDDTCTYDDDGYPSRPQTRLRVNFLRWYWSL